LFACVAAEAREFSGVLRHAERVEKLDWPLDFARKVWLNGRVAVLVANGPGPKLAVEAVDRLRKQEEIAALVSTGFCGALDPSLQPCDIFVATEVISAQANHVAVEPASSNHSAKTGKLLSNDRVVVTQSEKTELRSTGADAVEMEAAAVAERAREWNVPFYCIRVITDTAAESFPLDFNRMRDSEGRFSRARIIAAACKRPGVVFPELIKLNRRCNDAAKALGDFIAGCRF
jgi:adenosylhomocysteine nucleosidase